MATLDDEDKRLRSAALQNATSIVLTRERAEAIWCAPGKRSVKARDDGDGESALDRTRALRAGFAVHVAKPVDPSELVATVASVAGRVDRER